MPSRASVLRRSATWLLLVAAVGCGSSEGASAPPPTPPTAAPPSDAALLDRDGALEEGDVRGVYSLLDRYDVPVSAGDHVRVTVTSTAFDPVLEVTPPAGPPLTNDDYRGDRTRSELELVATAAGQLKIQVTSFAPGAHGAYHVRVERVGSSAAPSAPPAVAAAAPVRRHHVLSSLTPLSSLLPSPQGGAAQAGGAQGQAAAVPPAASAGSATPMPIQIGGRVSGTLAAGDGQLDSGELVDVYVLDLAAPADLTIQMQSSAFDSYLIVRGPNDGAWENDDSGGTRDAAVSIPQATPGQYRIFATSYRAGMTGAYELKVLSTRDAAAATAGAAEQVIAGELASGDRRLGSGEFFDEHRFTWPVGAGVRLEARSSSFDTYLILQTPSGQQRDNDDQAPGVTNAAMDFVVTEAGEHRVLVTSYAPGETGRYELVVRGGGSSGDSGGSATPTAPTVPAASPQQGASGTQTIRGELARGDATLQSGELADTHRMSFPAGAPVSIRLESSAFDSYLIVRSPSGRQQDNDDIRPGVLHSGIDIPAAEAGEYQIVVTSYRPGETGRYELTVSTGGGSAGPSQPGQTTPAAPGYGGSRVWLLSIGISDYPGSANDLPECANDAVKIAEALRNQGLVTPEREFLLTDGRATVSAIRDAMQRIAAQIQPDDTFVFFYSGHGGQRETPSNDPRELDSVDEYLYVYDGQLVDDELGRLTDAIRARTSLVAIDACYAGGFAKDLITRPGIVGLFSSEEDVTSAVASRFQAGGYLSHFLRLGIQGEADDDPRDNVMTVGELTHYVWQQYGRHASDIRMGDMGYQQLVVDRGAVRSSAELWRRNR